MNAQIARLGDGRWHFQHGPIDLVISIEGQANECDLAARHGADIFPQILPELVGELAILRQPLSAQPPALNGPVALRMAKAVWPWRGRFITPMAAVAGAVADHLLAEMTNVADCSKIIINNGGDIAFHIMPGERISAGIVGDPRSLHLDASVEIEAGQKIRGIATSGWRGRSQSLGIADAVTVLAIDAASADAAATMIANAVSVDHSAIRRLPAHEVKDDSDLGDMLVTVEVGRLPEAAIEAALTSGAALAHQALVDGLIAAAYLRLKGREKFVVAPALSNLLASAA